MADVNPRRVRELIEVEVAGLEYQTQRSCAMALRAVESMPLAVPSSVFALSPYPLTLVRGSGQFVWDLDDNRYVDYGNGYGTEVFGHANTEITEAIARRARDGTHFGSLSEEVVELSEHMCQRFSLDWIRFSPSGTEATMDAMRLARSMTGRRRIGKIEGAYHGSHPWVMASTQPDLGGGEYDAGPDDAPNPVPFGRGIEEDVIENVCALPFNDLVAAERALAEKDLAAIIVEPILFNVGAIFPEPGYLRGLRELCRRYDSLLIFDEVKTGASVSYGGAAELFDVQPDLKTFGKAIGGGLGAGAIGGIDDSGFKEIESWRAPHLGTFAGNPLTAAAGLVALRDVLTETAFEGLEEHRSRLASGLQEVIDEFELPAYIVGAGAKSCIVWADPESGYLRSYRDYAKRFDADLGYLTWVWMAHRGVWLTPGRDEQTTHSVFHGDQEIEAFVSGFRGLAQALRS